MTHRLWPDFFLVGAPRCGTTAMYTYLSGHPQIFMPRIKEPHFFATDIRRSKDVSDPDEYLDLFRQAGPAQRLGEASVWYLFSQAAAAEIARVQPAARIIMNLRNPLDMMYSLHAHFVLLDIEPLEDFVAAIEAEERRRKGQDLPVNGRPRIRWLYTEAARFSDQARRYIEVFGRENVHVVDFAALTRDPLRVYRDTLNFLGVDDGYAPDFEVINSSRRIRYPRFHRFMHRPVIEDIAAVAFPQWLRKQTIRRLKLGTVKLRRPPLAPETRAWLWERFRPEVDRLSDVVSIDLTHWYREDGPG